MAYTYLNSVYSMETLWFEKLLRDVNLDVFETLYAPFFNLSGEYDRFKGDCTCLRMTPNASFADYCDGPRISDYWIY